MLPLECNGGRFLGRLLLGLFSVGSGFLLRSFAGSLPALWSLGLSGIMPAIGFMSTREGTSNETTRSSGGFSRNVEVVHMVDETEYTSICSFNWTREEDTNFVTRFIPREDVNVNCQWQPYCEFAYVNLNNI